MLRFDNRYEVIMELLFVYTFIFWITAAIRTTATGEKDVERKYWYYLDPELIAEGLFVIASIMAYLKVLLICQISYDLGPLQVHTSLEFRSFNIKFRTYCCLEEQSSVKIKLYHKLRNFPHCY